MDTGFTLTQAELDELHPYGENSDEDSVLGSSSGSETDSSETDSSDKDSSDKDSSERDGSEAESEEDSSGDEVWTEVDVESKDYRLFIDEDLFASAGRDELLQVAKNMEKEIGPFQKKSFMSHLYIWLERSGLLGNLKRAIQQGLPDGAEPLLMKELFYFVFYLLEMSACCHSVSGHYGWDRTRPSQIKQERFCELLRALSGATTTRSKRAGPKVCSQTSEATTADSATVLPVPYGTSKELKLLSRAMEDFAAFASKIGFIPGKTVLSMDDDVMRNFSNDINLGIGAKMDYSEKKGAGLKIDSTGSVVSGLVLSEYIQRPSDGKGQKSVLAAIVKNLDNVVEGCSPYDQDEIKPILALDRFYQSEEIVDTIVKKGFHVVGTVKRHFGFPFVFGNTRIKTDHPWGQLDMKQPPRVTWAKRNIEGTEEHAYAAGIIDGLGHAILMQTTALEYGPGTFAYNLYDRSKEAMNKVMQFPAKPFEENDDVFDETGGGFVESPLSATAGERSKRHHQRNKARSKVTDNPSVSEDHSLRCWSAEEMNEANWERFCGEDVAKAVNDTLAAEDFFDYIGDEADPFSMECIAELVTGLYLNKSRLLTAAQGSKDWFYLRFGRLTSTTTYAALRALAIGYRLHSMDSKKYPLSGLSSAIEVEVSEVFGAVGIDVAAIKPLNPRRLKKKKKEALKGILNSLGYQPKSNATKAELVQLILNMEEPDVFKACISSFLMKPLPDLEPLRIGKANEDLALELLEDFVQKNKVSGRVLIRRSLGLLHEINNKHQADSPDGIFFYEPIDDKGQRVLFGKVGAAVVEVKTKTSEKTLAKERKLAKSYGKVKEIYLPRDAKELCASVPDVKHRVQILAHSAGKKLEIWYVVAQAVKSRGVSKLVRMVRVLVDEGLHESFKTVMFKVAKEHLAWFYSNDFPMPDESKFEFTKGSWSTSKASFVHHRAIAMTLDEAIAEREAPLPPARNIFPRLISFWNIAKAPTDKKSQILKSIQPNLFKFGTMARVWVRVVLGGAVCNAVRTYRLDCLSSAVRDKKIISLRQFRNRANALGSFSDTLKQQMTVHQWLQFESVQPTTPVAPQTQVPGHTKIFWKGNVELDLTQEAQKLDQQSTCYTTWYVWANVLYMQTRSRHFSRNGSLG